MKTRKNPTSFPGSLLFTAPWDAKRRDPGNEVGKNPNGEKKQQEIWVGTMSQALHCRFSLSRHQNKNRKPFNK